MGVPSEVIQANQVPGIEGQMVGNTPITDVKVPFMFQIPFGLKVALETAAKERGTTASAMVREAAAALVGYSLPASRSVERKYGSKEERQKAQYERNKSRRDQVKAALAAARSAGGLVEDDDDEDEED